MKNRLDLLASCDVNQIPNVIISKQKRDETFKFKDNVLCRDQRNPNRKAWVKAEIDEVLGQRTYLCKIKGEYLIWKRHLKRQGDDSQESDIPPTNNMSSDCNLPDYTLSFPAVSDSEVRVSKSKSEDNNKKRIEEKDVTNADTSDELVLTEQVDQCLDKLVTLSKRHRRVIKPPARLNL